jgi:hypothetical protein
MDRQTGKHTLRQKSHDAGPEILDESSSSFCNKTFTKFEMFVTVCKQATSEKQRQAP